MNELIEKLKDKNYVRVFGLMTPEEQECFMKVGKKNCLFYSLGGWNIGDNEFFVDITTYAIKPDYQSEPEFVDLEIIKYSQGTVEQSWWLGVWKYSDLEEHKFLPHLFTHLHILPSLPNFEGFKEEHVEGTLAIERIARYIHEGKKVFARFRV